jgi:micrococcal nuclease
MYEYKVKEVVKVVDGDTIDVIIDLGFDLSKKERVRLAGIDTPESRTRDLDEKN